MSSGRGRNTSSTSDTTNIRGCDREDYQRKGGGGKYNGMATPRERSGKSAGAGAGG